jgi:2-phosphoglycolate phosphatase
VQTRQPIQAVLFDLDGTLADTAPDLGGALNRLREEAGMQPLPLDGLRPHASNGARGLIGAGFGIDPKHERFPDLLKRFLALYENQVCTDTRLFPGVAELLVDLEQRSIPWGVVTNKIARFTQPVMAGLDLVQRAACIVSGDTAARPKPDPAPLLMACSMAGVEPDNALYLGDDLRDVQAGRAAGMLTVIAAWGYLAGSPSGEWGADVVIDHPSELIGLLDRPC